MRSPKRGMKVKLVKNKRSFGKYYYGHYTDSIPLGSIGVIAGGLTSDHVSVYLPLKRRLKSFHPQELARFSRIHPETRIKIDDLFYRMALNRLGLPRGYPIDLVLYPILESRLKSLEKATLPVDMRRDYDSFECDLENGAEGIAVGRRRSSISSTQYVAEILGSEDGSEILSLSALPGDGYHSEITELLLKYALTRAYLLNQDSLSFSTWGRHRCRKEMESMGFQEVAEDGSFRNGEPKVIFQRDGITKKEVLKYARKLAVRIPRMSKAKAKEYEEQQGSPRRRENRRDSPRPLMTTSPSSELTRGLAELTGEGSDQIKRELEPMKKDTRSFKPILDTLYSEPFDYGSIKYLEPLEKLYKKSRDDSKY